MPTLTLKNYLIWVQQFKHLWPTWLQQNRQLIDLTDLIASVLSNDITGLKMKTFLADKNEWFKIDESNDWFEIRVVSFFLKNLGILFRICQLIDWLLEIYYIILYAQIKNFWQNRVILNRQIFSGITALLQNWTGINI